MNDMQKRITNLRLALLKTIDGLGAKSKEYQLPSVSNALSVARNKLASDQYKVMVMGEVKRGKSTFINALVGQVILPTDVDVATSQVFRIMWGEELSCRIRFADESAQQVELEDLPKYGSQVVQDVQGTPRLDQIIKWIEIDVPIRFLPRTMCILDTPGLGGLYELHAEITQRHIPESDAVVFVLDSTRPIIEEELRYIENALSATNSIFFIQTKIDLFRRSQWQEILRRNEEILTQRFGDRLSDIQVWPISSILLQKAAIENDPDFEMASKHADLAIALNKFLFRVAGWNRAAEAIILTGDHLKTTLNTLHSRRRSILDTSNQRQQEFRRQLAEIKSTFVENWGNRGKNRQEVANELKKIEMFGKEHITQYLSRDGELENTFRTQIEQASSIDEVNTIMQQHPDNASARASRVWREVSEKSWEKSLALLGTFMKDVEGLNIAYPGEQHDLSLEFVSPQISKDWYAKIKGARWDGLTGFFLGKVSSWVGGGILVGLGMLSAPLLPAVVVFGAITGSLVAMFKGTKTIDQNQLRSAKQEALRCSSDVCREIRKHFLSANYADEADSPVNQHFKELERTVINHIEETLKSKEAETNAEIQRLENDEKLDQQKREAEAERLRTQIETFNQMGMALKNAESELTQLDQDIRGADVVELAS